MKLNEVATIEQLLDNEFITVVTADGSIGKIRKDLLIPYTGSEYRANKWATTGWHRILIGINNNLANSGVVNIGNDYGNDQQSFSCFHVYGSGYRNRNIVKINGDGAVFKKCRIVYKPIVYDILYIDIYYGALSSNNVRVAISSAFGIRLSDMSDTIAVVPEGYSVQEFDL